MQVREVFFRARGPFQRLHIRLKLDQVAGHKSRREAEVAKRLGVPEATARARVSRGLRALARALDPAAVAADGSGR